MGFEEDKDVEIPPKLAKAKKPVDKPVEEKEVEKEELTDEKLKELAPVDPEEIKEEEKKTVSAEEVIINHEQRITNLEATMYRLRSI